MAGGRSRWARPAVAVLVVLAATVAALVALRPADPPDRAAGGLAPLVAEVVQQRGDEVTRRVQVAVTNTRAEPIRVQSLLLTVPGFHGGPAIPRDSPIEPGRTVNLPTVYGEPRCAADGTPPRAGRPVVRLRVRTGAGPAAAVTLTPRDPDRVLDRILARECLALRLGRVVRVRFAPGWRREGSGPDVRLHGRLRVRLLDGAAPYELTQVAGTVIYSFAPARPGTPLARVDATRPAASVPVVVSVSRCDGHARGETKKPYEFLVWLAEPGGPEQPLTVPVSAADRAALQAVCPL